MIKCIKEANTKIVNDIKKWYTKSNVFIAVVVVFLIIEFITIIETLNAYIPYPSPLVGSTVAVLFVLWMGAQVVYAFYVYDACMDKKKEKS